MDGWIYVILFCGIAVVFCDEKLNREKRDHDSSHASENSIKTAIGNFLTGLFGSNATTAAKQPLNATTTAATLTSFLSSQSPTSQPSQSSTSSSATSSSSFPSSTTFSSTTTTTSTTSSWPTWSVENADEDKCYTNAVLQNFCTVPSDMTDVSFWDLYSVIFSDTIVDALVIGCTHGSWCLKGKFDYWEALVVERVEMVMNSNVTNTMCTPEIAACIDKIDNTFINCSTYSEMIYTGKAIHLICQLKQNTELTSECYKHTLTALHVSLADVTRKKDALDEEVTDRCDSPKVNMAKGMICVDNSCPNEAGIFRRFEPWGWFTDDLEDLMSECELDPNKCVGHLQVGSSSAYPSTSTSSMSYTSESAASSWAWSVSSSSSWIQEGQNDVTTTPYDSDSYGDIMKGNQAYESDIKTMVGISVATMVTAIMMTLAVCTFYKRHRRNTVIKEGYQQLLNDADES